MGLKRTIRNLKAKINEIKENNKKKARIKAFQKKCNVDNKIINAKLTNEEKQIYIEPAWYHDFKILGMETPILFEGGYIEAQNDKQYEIFKLIDKVVEILKKENKSEIKGAELFCADGFYSNYALQKGADYMYGVDLEEDSGEGEKRTSVLAQARVISKILGNENKTKFEKLDVFKLNGHYDFVLNLDGLYHISNPEELIAKLRDNTEYLIIQTVVTKETEDENYFVTPCPGWTWGCRFTYKYLLNMLKRTGWEIISESQNELTWNMRLCDKGSSYVLAKKV